jgi:hypothetical protein
MMDPTEGGCSHDPRTREGRAIAMYHCPDCGLMVLAGCPHPPIVRRADGSVDYDDGSSARMLREELIFPVRPSETIEEIDLEVPW